LSDSFLEVILGRSPVPSENFALCYKENGATLLFWRRIGRVSPIVVATAVSAALLRWHTHGLQCQLWCSADPGSSRPRTSR